MLPIAAQAQEVPSGDFSAVSIVANRWSLKQIRPRDATSHSAVDREIFFRKSLLYTLHSKYAACESSGDEWLDRRSRPNC